MISYCRMRGKTTCVPALSQPVTTWDSGRSTPNSPASGRHSVLARVLRTIVASLVVAGCTEVDRAYHSVSNAVQTAFSEPRHASTPTRATHSSAAPSSSWDSGAAPAAKTSPTPEPTPVELKGLSGSAARALLGQPAARGGTAPGETWTYRSGSCEVELFLFPDVKQGDMQVLDYRVTGAGAHTEAGQACLRRLRDGQSS